jgi:hypothetical protein
MINKAGKTLTIFIVLTFILLISSTSIGFFLYHKEEHSHKSVESDLDTAHANNDKLQAQLKDIQAQLALAEDKNKEADQKINNLLDEQDLNEGLRNALKKENAQLKDQMASIELSKQKIKSDLDNAISQVSVYQRLLKAAEGKAKELEVRFANLMETNKNMEARLDGSSSGDSSSGGHGENDKMELDKIVVNPQDGKGYILSVDTDAEFVVFNLGIKQGVKSNDVLSVYRGGQYLGDIKATRVQDEMSAADIVPPLSSRQLRKNDIVVLKP